MKLTTLQLINLTGYYLQLEERMKADCMPVLAKHARRQYRKYKMRLNARRVNGAN